MKAINIGKEIEKIFRESGMAGTEFAKLIGKDRQIIYDIFARKSIQTNLLLKISHALKFNFFKLYSDNHKLK